jgi:hypothetical protein
MALSTPGYRLKPHGKGYVNYSGAYTVKIKNGFNASGIPIAAGVPITLDTVQDNLKTEAPNVKAWTSTSQVILGWAAQPNVSEYQVPGAPLDGNDYIAPNRPVPYIDRDSMTVISETAFTPAQYNTVFMRSSGTGSVGDIRNAAVAGQTVSLTGVKVLSMDSYGGVNYARIEVSPNVTVVAN